MGQVTVEEVSIDSHLKSEEMLRAILSGEPVQITFIADGGNGARVNLDLEPDVHISAVREMLKKEEIQELFRALGFSLENNREFYEKQDELKD